MSLPIRCDVKNFDEVRQTFQRLSVLLDPASQVALIKSMLAHSTVIPAGGVDGQHLSADALNRIRSILAGSLAGGASASSVAWNSDQNILANQIFGS